MLTSPAHITLSHGSARNIQAAAATQEAYYTEVPEEEQMYAEIESGHNSAGSSVTYARIEPRTTEPHPPAPPTVESLKSVAQAHSRQG